MHKEHSSDPSLCIDLNKMSCFHEESSRLCLIEADFWYEASINSLEPLKNQLKYVLILMKSYFNAGKVLGMYVK